MPNKSDLEYRRNYLADRILALRDPIPDETHEEREERLAALHAADREHEKVKGELRALEYDERTREGEVGPRPIDEDRDPEEELRQSFKDLDDWAERDDPDDDQRHRNERADPDDNGRER